jgi:hypothetical protein
MTLIEYYSYIGGLIGLWNGLSIKDIQQITFVVINIIANLINNTNLLFIKSYYIRNNIHKKLHYSYVKIWKLSKVNFLYLFN